MDSKFDYYDILGIIIPGIILMFWVPVCFPNIVNIFPKIKLPDAFIVLALTAGSVFLGQLVQAIGSIAEPALFWTWGGRPSNQALENGLGRYISKNTAKRVKEKIESRIGTGTENNSLFLFAMQLAETASIGRASRFNALYAYHRGLFVLVFISLLFFIGSIIWGAAVTWSIKQIFILIIFLVLLMILVWNRAKQRAFYYVREVLLTAESILNTMSK